MPFEDSSLKVLERRLNEKSRAQKFEVINFAVPGYNTAMEAETFVARCLEYAPDLVLLNFNTNDYDVPNFMRRPGDLATLRKSYLFDLAYSVYDGVMGLERQPPPFDFMNRTTALRQAEHLDEDPALPDEYRYMVGAKGVVRALERLAAAARERAIPFVVFTVKAYPGLDPKYERDEWRDGQRELLERESRRLGFHFLNTYPYYHELFEPTPRGEPGDRLRGVRNRWSPEQPRALNRRAGDLRLPRRSPAARVGQTVERRPLTGASLTARRGHQPRRTASSRLYSRIFTAGAAGPLFCASARNACSDCATMARARSFL